ncbi:MAG: DUF1800 domain-containing protein [Chitinophagaceae bacterium]|nr:DUF1800 domain-containing protein [Chitinophagaceae bacterium]MCW5926304.1 DUF1800 domain-containing protein [Chitinophagaceae bacterium]
MDRRSFLSLKREKLSKKFVTGRTQSGITPYTGPWTRNEVIHLLKRTMFGASLQDIKYFEQRTMEASVNELLTITAPLPTPPLKDYDASDAEAQPDNNIAPGATWVNDYNTDGGIGQARNFSFQRWWISRVLHQDRNIREKMTLFWHNHFATQMSSSNNGRLTYKHHQMLRQHALGNLKWLVKAVTLDPLMLVFQNGEHNRKESPDENYARELQELFSIGKENNPNYTEDDVKAAARVLTGWRINYETVEPFFTPERHDTGNKSFSSFYNNRVITGRAGAAGAQEVDDLIDMIFSKSREASVYVVKELYKWFVYYEIDAAAQANVIDPLAQMLVNYNWDIKPVVETLLKSEHFFDVLNQGCLIKGPADFIFGLCREFDVQLPSGADWQTEYAVNNLLSWIMKNLDQDLGEPPSVSGWPAYYQMPVFHEIWITNNTYPKRTEFTDMMTMSNFTVNNFELKIDVVAFAKTLSNPGDPNSLLNDSLEILYRIDLSEGVREQLKRDILLTGQTNDYYWTNAWNAHIANPSNMMAYQTVFTRLSELYQYLLALPEYHLS